VGVSRASAGGAGFRDGGSGDWGCDGGSRLSSSARRRCISSRVGTCGRMMPLIVFRSMFRHSYGYRIRAFAAWLSFVFDCGLNN
jgi:hypothetical protein